MKIFKLSILLAAAALMIVGMQGTTYAFHDGGVAYCEGCHTMHESINGAPAMITGLTGTVKNLVPSGDSQFVNVSPYLLKGSDQSSTCLNCHRQPDTAPTSYHIMSEPTGTGTPVERTPGGDFAWIIGPTNTKAPANHRGHQIIARDYGLTTASPNYTVSPGGNYPANQLYCNSCHDPHSAARMDSTAAVITRNTGSSGLAISGSGSYNNSAFDAGAALGVYRFLGGNGYVPKSATGAAAFTANPPFAVAPATYNQSEWSGSALSPVRVAYGSGMSEWCGNCHASILNNVAGTGTNHIHPAGSSALLSQGEGALYNAYVASGDMSGTSANSYNTLVPYEEGLARSGANYATLQTHANNNGSYTAGPTSGTENVMCLSCHRAHASAWNYGLRWNADVGPFVTEGGQYAGSDNVLYVPGNTYNSTGYTRAQMQAAFYDRPETSWVADQRSLCNKCHAKD